MIRFRFEGSSSRNAPQSQPSAEDTPTGRGGENAAHNSTQAQSPQSLKIEAYRPSLFLHYAWGGSVSLHPFNLGIGPVASRRGQFPNLKSLPLSRCDKE